ncbi:hypothetical protein [Planosporangium mesophilum]|uniref:Uncharacterized protein n=1 Tax=Planosporangium mesophilum TaxID=689768 RepID=A0A8J3TEE0_9ACTN|nr:hypothetical protein [Planosporangium mesophilum]NJC85282.1 hypothetical protein [Planosporangium mesophilum]GII23264.1 hypothetical protein Pme01_28610 [Planosporangium mesophilum]
MGSTVSPATESELISKILSTVDRINGKTTELQNRINDKMHWLPSGLQDKVVSGWNKFVGVLKEIWDFWYEVATHLGSPSKLSATADAWSDSVGGPVSAQVQTADAGTLLVDDNWDGDAANAYRQTLPQQKAALDKIKSSFTDGIASALSDVSKGIIAFWVALVSALAAFVVGIIGALSSAATIFGLPASPFIAAGAALVASAAVVGGMLILKSVCMSAATSMRQKLNDNGGFRDGHWPPAAKY